MSLDPASCGAAMSWQCMGKTQDFLSSFQICDVHCQRCKSHECQICNLGRYCSNQHHDQRPQVDHDLDLGVFRRPKLVRGLCSCRTIFGHCRTISSQNAFRGVPAFFLLVMGVLPSSLDG